MRSSQTMVLLRKSISTGLPINAMRYVDKQFIRQSSRIALEQTSKSLRQKCKPIFGDTINELLLPKIESDLTNPPKKVEDEKKTFLDMTFGTGCHSAFLLEHASARNIPVSLVASDFAPSVFQTANGMAHGHPASVLTPIQSRFSKLPSRLIEAGFAQKSFDGIIIDTGYNSQQLNDSERVFSSAPKGDLDLRIDSILSNEQPTASEVLQHIDERTLCKMLKTYGELGSWSKNVAVAIIEARYMFHRFQTTQELWDILCQVSQSIISTSDIDIKKVRKKFGRQFQSKSLETEEKSTHSVNNGQYCMNQEITDILLRQTLRALRIFVNDEINELDFALRNLAPEFLRSDSGKLIVIVNSMAEQKMVNSLFHEVNLPFSIDSKQKLNADELKTINHKHWKNINCVSPLNLPKVQKCEYPNTTSAVLFAATCVQ